MAAGASIPAIPFDVNLKPSCTRIVALNGDMPFLLPVRDMTIQVQVHVAGTCCVPATTPTTTFAPDLSGCGAVRAAG